MIKESGTRYYEDRNATDQNISRTKKTGPGDGCKEKYVGVRVYSVSGD